jgi:hypothetical protein
MELHNFPFDAQELSITLISKIKDKTIKLISKQFSLSKNAKYTFLEQQRYELLELVEVSHIASYDFGSKKMLSALELLKNNEKLEKEHERLIKRPMLSVKCFVVRRPIYYVLNAFFLIFLITITALTFFSINCKYPQNRLQSTGTTLLTSISLKWVTNRALPTVNYTTSLDRYSIIHIVYLILLIFWHSIIGSFWDDKDLSRLIDMYALISFSGLLALIELFFIASFIFGYKKIIDLKKREKAEKITQSTIGSLGLISTNC